MIATKKSQHKCLENIIGNTPLVGVNLTYRGQAHTIYVKLENYNMTGSIKDRVALHVIHKSYENGLLKPGDEIVEATSGNMGISFSAIGAFFNHPVTIYMPDWMSVERKRLIESYGANIVLVSKEQGGFLGSIDMTKKHKTEKENVFLPCQFDNTYNIECHYLTTGAEIYAQMTQLNLTIDAFVAGVGTGGTIMGVSKFLKEKNPNIKTHPLEPSNSPTLSTGHKIGKHRIQGISDEFIPSIVDLDALDSIIEVDDGDAIIMAQKLSNSLGLGVGISSGANFLGAILAKEKLGANANVVTIFCDCNKKYLSTDLCCEEPVKSDFLSSQIELEGLQFFN